MGTIDFGILRQDFVAELAGSFDDESLILMMAGLWMDGYFDDFF